MRINKRLKILLLVLVGFMIVSVIFFQWTVSKAESTSTAENSPNVEKANAQDFNNCIIVQKDKAALVLAQVETNFNYATLAKELPSKLKGINNLNIIYTKDAVYNNVVKVMNTVAATGMQNYKLLKK